MNLKVFKLRWLERRAVVVARNTVFKSKDIEQSYVKTSSVYFVIISCIREMFVY